MTGARLVASCVLGLGLTAATASAQMPSSIAALLAPAATSGGQLAALLESADPRQQAWGAWIAGRDRRRDLIPLLLRRLDGSTQPFPASLVPVVVLDALIELRAEVPPSVVRGLPEGFQTQAMILLTMAGPDADADLVDIVGRGSGLRWYTAANLLVQRRSPSLARLLLRGLEISVTLYVSPDGLWSGASLDGFSGMVGCGAGSEAPGYPPIAWYVLSSAAGSDALSVGPKNTYYRRTVSMAGTVLPFNSHDIGGPNMNDRIGYLAALLPVVVPFRSAYESFSLAWTTQAAVDAEVTSIRQDIGRRHAQLVQALIDRALLSPADLPVIAPTIRVDVQYRK